MRTRNDKISRMLAPVVLGAVAMAAAGGASSLLARIAQNGPVVGDIITFDTANAIAAESNVRLPVERVGRLGCVLDLDTISHRGGSMVLEAQLADGARPFLLHWAGTKTSLDAADCGANAYLMVDRHDIDILAFAAGGYGVGQKRPPFTVASEPL